MIKKNEAIAIARKECAMRGWKDLPPYEAQSGRDYILWGKLTWFVVTNAGTVGDNAYVNIDGDSGKVIGAAFATMEESKRRKGIWKLWG